MEREGRYWHVERGEWVRYEVPPVEVPPQPTGVEADQEADVRSG